MIRPLARPASVTADLTNPTVGEPAATGQSRSDRATVSSRPAGPDDSSTRAGQMLPASSRPAGPGVDEAPVCPIQSVVKIIGGKWKLVIIWHLAGAGVIRYGELKKSIAGITHKMLSQELKELEALGLVHRREYHQIPPKVEYSLAEKGYSLLPILDRLQDWVRDNLDQAAGSGNDAQTK